MGQIMEQYHWGAQIETRWCWSTCPFALSPKKCPFERRDFFLKLRNLKRCENNGLICAPSSKTPEPCRFFTVTVSREHACSSFVVRRVAAAWHRTTWSRHSRLTIATGSHGGQHGSSFPSQPVRLNRVKLFCLPSKTNLQLFCCEVACQKLHMTNFASLPPPSIHMDKQKNDTFKM